MTHAVWATISFINALKFSLTHNNYPRGPFRQFFISKVVSSSLKANFHPFLNQKMNNMWYCTGKVTAEEVWVVQCGPNGLLSELGARIYLIHRNGDIATRICECYEMRECGFEMNCYCYSSYVSKT
jgi:hypothetical protein